MDDQTNGVGASPQPPQPPQATGTVQEPSRRGPGAAAGAWLILIGVVVLAAQLTPGLAWWTLWPLVIVVAGAIHAFTPGDGGWGVHRLFDGLVTVSWGLVFLAITMGYVSFSVMWEIIGLWPVLLIAIGFDLLGKAMHLSWVRAIGSLAVIVALAYAVATSGGYVRSTTGPVAGDVRSEPVGSVRDAAVSIDVGAGDISVSPGTDLVSVAGSATWGEPSVTVARHDSRAEVAIESPGNDTVVIDPSDAELDVMLADTVLWDAELSCGAARADVDLTGVPVRSLVLKTGVGECTARLGEVPNGVEHAEATVEAGISSITVLVPAGVEARIESDSGLAAHSVRGDFVAQGGRVWETPDYQRADDSGQPVWDITIKTGIGAVSVDTY